VSREAVIHRLAEIGVNRDDAIKLRRIALTLHRWYELECGSSDDYGSWMIERDEQTGKPYWIYHSHRSADSQRMLISDRERGAEKRLAKIMGNYPDLVSYLQTDPRGWPLYILRKSDIPEGAQIDSCYNRGVGVFK